MPSRLMGGRLLAVAPAQEGQEIAVVFEVSPRRGVRAIRSLPVRRSRTDVSIKLHRCSNEWLTIAPHPCWKIQKALDEQGIARIRSGRLLSEAEPASW